MNGIDISSWQKNLIVSNLSDDTEFVIVKATGGTGYLNPYFSYHMEQTVTHGKLVGAYHYAREKGYKGTPASEAEYFLKTVGKYINKAILALDWEEEVNLGPGWTFEWLEYVHSKTGVKPLLYTSQSVCSSYDWAMVANSGYKLWLAQYANMKQVTYQEKPWRNGSIGAFDSPIIHQYSGNGVISGYSGAVDLNKFYGTATDWKQLATGGSVQSTEQQEKISDDMKWAIENGLFLGDGNGKYFPKEPLTREQAASVLRRMMETGG